MDTSQAAQEAVSGGLVGIGCAPHEAKAASRKERWADKRKSRSEWKQVVKMRKVEVNWQAKDGEAMHAPG